MNYKDIFAVIENNAAPVALSDELCAKYGHYDNSGVLVENTGEIIGVLFSLDLTCDAVDEAIKRQCNLIVTHHPAIYHGLKRIAPSNDLVSRAIVKCIRHNIAVISMHLNFDSAPEGIDYYLMKGLGGEREEGILQPLSSGGYGRIYPVEPVTFREFVRRTKVTFGAERCFAYGDPGRIVRKVASFCGAGCGEEAAGMAINGGADVLVSADIPHHMITGLYYNNVNVLQLTHYSSEVYGFKMMANKLSPLMGVPVCIYADPQLM